MNFDLKVKLYLENNSEKFMGIGVLWLLQKINQGQSLRSAANELGISYTKAYAMIANLETALGRQILIRQRGGQNRIGSRLSNFAKSFMALYDDFQSECKVRLTEPFEVFKEKLVELEATED